jgi:hypothetical protein
MRTVGITTLVIPDTSSTQLNLATSIAQADAEIDEAARAGNYEVPFDPVPAHILNLSAVGAIARARRALELGNQEQSSQSTERYLTEFELGLERLRTGALDLGTVTVNSEGAALGDTQAWSSLAHRALVPESVTVTNAAGSFTYVEDRAAYDPDYLPDTTKDYLADHREGKLRRTQGSRIANGETVRVSYDYYYRQSARLGDEEYSRRTASPGDLLRGDWR